MPAKELGFTTTLTPTVRAMVWDNMLSEQALALQSTLVDMERQALAVLETPKP